jgi:hypothetical protein
MTDTAENWVLFEAAKRAGYHWLNHTVEDLQDYYVEGEHDDLFRALCDMIAKHEQPPVDRKLLCAREAGALDDANKAYQYRSGSRDSYSGVKICIRAIELWEEGFGK